jgi:hypothetical protein
MTLTWRYFGGASILAAGLLLKFGAPLSAVLLGIAGVAGTNWWRQRRPAGLEGGNTPVRDAAIGLTRLRRIVRPVPSGPETISFEGTGPHNDE